MNAFRRVVAFLALLLPGLSSGEYLRDAKGNFIPYAGKLNRSRIMLRDVPPRRDEFRGVWIATVDNIDFPKCRTVAEFKQLYRDRVRKLAAAGFTAVIFQVRSNCDAFYPTELAPWSRALAGKEGVGFRDFDPLRFMVDEAHRNGLEFHAWFNPYRVTKSAPQGKSAYLRTLSSRNIARKHPEWVLAQSVGGKTKLFLDPGEPQVVRHVAAVVREVALKYPVDAIHFDDYFYPYEPLNDEDARSFAAYNPRRLKRDDWRRSNVDALIVAVRRAVDQANAATRRHVRFGVSPFGIWANRKNHPAGSLTSGVETCFRLYADTRKWVKYQVLDYIAPQIYWHFGHDAAPYAALVDWWCETVRGTKVKLYIGQGAYRAGEWDAAELVNQTRYNRMRPEVSGEAYFSYRSLFAPKVPPGAIRLHNYLRGR